MTKPAGQRAVAGDSIRDVVTASAWNDLLDMRDAWRRSGTGFNVAPGEATSGACVIEVKNDTGEDLNRFACVGLNDVTVAPSDNADEFIERHVIIASTPSTQHATKFAILQEAIPAGEIGRAVICGKTIAIVNVVDETHQYAAPEAGTYRLKSARTGPCRIVYAESIGVEPALVVLGVGDVTATESPSCCGCSPTECFDFQFWEIQGGCPRYFALTVDDDIGCCNGDAGGTHILEYQAASGYERAMWKGPSFQCGTAGDDCGASTWTWEAAATCGSVTYTWLPGSGICAIANTTIYWTPGFPNCVAGSWSGGFCGDGCVPENTGPPEDPCETQSRTVPCVLDYTWVADGSCNCGTAPEPGQAGEYIGQTVTVPCDYTGDPGQWVLTDDQCSCGEPVPPETAGSVEGEARITNCVDPDAAPECGTSTWERRVCEYIGIAWDCSRTISDLIGTGYYPTNECTMLVANGDNQGCSTPRNPINRGNIYGYRTPEGTWVGLQPGETLTESQWVLVSDDCTCGMAIPPRQDLYAPDGTQLTRPCESPLLAYWRLIPPTGYDPAEVQFVVDGNVKIRYRLPYLRSYCCQCQMRFDVVVGDPCSFPCRGVPQSVCVRPIRSGPPGGSCLDLSPIYSLYVEGFEEWPCRNNASDFCTERATRHDDELATWPIPFEGHPSYANGEFLLALTNRACCGNTFSDPGPVDTCGSLACLWTSQPGTFGELCAATDTWCVDGIGQSGGTACTPCAGSTPSQLWKTTGKGRWWLQNYTGDTTCGDGPKLYLSTSEQGDNVTPYENHAERYDYWETLDDGSIVFKYTTNVANQDKFPQYVMLVPVTDL